VGERYNGVAFRGSGPEIIRGILEAKIYKKESHVL
jgi:hypothetical protein